MATEARSSSQRSVDSLAARLRRRQVVGSRQTAVETVIVLRQVIASSNYKQIDDLLQRIRSVGKQLSEAQPQEHAVANAVRRVMHHIREEYNAVTKGSKEAKTKDAFSLEKFVHMGQPRKHSSSQKLTNDLHATYNASFGERDPEDQAQALKPVLMEAVQYVWDELDTVYENISKSARDHIHSDEIILTIGKSKTVESFLKSAAHYRKFTVIVAESGPSFSGHEMARDLSREGISTFLVPDSSIYAIMSRVNKVILGAHAILANGGMYAISGALLAATAARAHSTPVVVCAGQFKLTPVWNLNHEYSTRDFANPNNVLGFNENELVEKAMIINPHYDYVNPEFISVFTTNDGDHPPTSIHRLMKETYDDEDHVL